MKPVHLIIKSIDNGYIVEDWTKGEDSVHGKPYDYEISCFQTLVETMEFVNERALAIQYANQKGKAQ